MAVTIVSPTPGVQPGSPGGFSANEAVARDTPIVVDITSTSADRVELASPGEPDMSKRRMLLNGVIQGTWALRSTKTPIAGGFRYSFLPEKGWSANVLQQLALAIDTVAAGGNILPTADFTFVLNANRTVQFTDTSSDPDGTIAAWSWTFGDAGTSSLQNPSHAYAAGGSYSVGLTVTDNLGGVSTTTTKTVYVWQKDATSLKGVPETTADWNAVLASVGIGTAGPSSIYLMQDAAGSAADVIGGKSLAVLASGTMNYQQAVAGWTRKALKTIDNINMGMENTTFPNINANSMLALVYCLAERTNATGGAIRTIMRIGTAFNSDVTLEEESGAGLRTMLGAGQSSTRYLGSTYEDVVRPFIVRETITHNHADAFADNHRIAGGNGNWSGTCFRIGGDNNQTYFPDTASYLYGAVWTGASAELTETQIKNILVALGWTVPWSPRQSITKNAGVPGTFDASAATAIALSGTISVEFKVTNTTTNWCIGLSADNPDNNYNTIDFALAYDPSGNMYPSANGTLGSPIATVAGDVWKITRTTGTGAVTVTKNGSLAHTFGGTTTALLCVDSSIASNFGVITDILITDGSGVALYPGWSTSNAVVS